MSVAFKLKGLREQRGVVRKQLEALGDRIRKEQRAMTADETELFKKLQSDWVALGDAYRTAEGTIQQIDDLLSQDDSGDVQENSRRVPGMEDRDGRPRSRDVGAEVRKLAFQAWARSQHDVPLNDDHHRACKRAGIDPRSKSYEFRIGGSNSILKRANGVGSSSLGGAAVAPDYAYELEKALVDFSNVRGVCGQFTTDTGADLPYPTEDDTGNVGAQLGEHEETPFEDDSFGTVTFKGFKFTSKGILISNELLNDAAFDLEAHIGEQLGNRIGRIQGQRFTTGTGTGQPQGIVTASTLGVGTGGATAFTADELTLLAFSIDRAYRSDPSCGYMMHDSAVAYALLLKDGQNRPLLRESYRDGIVIPLLNGFPVNTNQYMDPLVNGLPVTGKKHVLFGAMSKHKIRDVGTVRVRRLDERYAEKDQVGFVGFMRSDSRCVNNKAIKHLLQA